MTKFFFVEKFIGITLWFFTDKNAEYMARLVLNTDVRADMYACKGTLKYKLYIVKTI